MSGEESSERMSDGGKEMKNMLSCPANPLPDEITKMQHSETVCRFCGVSYLIFHEFRQLQTQIANMQSELQELRCSSEREKAQRESLELGRLEWERALRLEILRNSKEKEQEKQMETERALREEFEQQYEKQRRRFEESCEEISEQKERQLRRELEDLEAEWLKNHQKELKRSEEREKVLTATLQTANKKVDKLRKCVRQLDERLSVAISKKEEAERLLGKEKKIRKCLRDVCAQQNQALQATQSELRVARGALKEIQGFVSHMTGSWQVFRANVLQQCSQVSSVLEKTLRHSSEELLTVRKEKEFLAEQLTNLRREKEERMLHQENAAKVHKENILRLKGELEDEREKWLSCQQKCNILEEQLRSWQQKEAQLNRKYRAAEEEVERLLREAAELRRQSELLKESHKSTLSKMEKDYKRQITSEFTAAREQERTQNALHLKEQLEALENKFELQMKAEKETNELLLQQHQRDKTQLQQELTERNREIVLMQEEVEKERISGKENRKRREDEKRKLEGELQHIRQQGELKLRERDAELHQKAEIVSELTAEVSVLQETVRRECMEREELTAALSQAHQKILGLQHPSSETTERHAPAGNKPTLPQRHTRSFTLHSTPQSCRDTNKGICEEKGGAGRRLEFWSSSGMSDGNKRSKGTLPRLK